jgi:glucose-1-phosphate adenylyltransferase
MKRVLAIILGGGAGTRLHPLTQSRAKPAVPIAGKYRLVDIPVSNCLNSEISKIYVLTQFNSCSLNRHVNRAFRFGGVVDGFVEVLAAQMTVSNSHWFRGTADAVRQFSYLIEQLDVDHVLILSGDQIYRMDYRLLLEEHKSSGVDMTLVVVPVPSAEGSRFGLLKLDEPSRRILEFREKPRGASLEEMRIDTGKLGLSPSVASECPFLGSAGIYLFNKDVLLNMLSAYPQYHDFGSDLIPVAVEQGKVGAYIFDGYWEDVGTVRSFYEANLALAAQNNARFSFYDAREPIYTASRHLPPSKLQDCQITESMISEGCIVKRSKIADSLLGIRTRISDGCTIERSVLMGANFTETTEDRQLLRSRGAVPLGIGERSTVVGAIVDKNARIGSDVQICNLHAVQEADRSEIGYMIRDGIVVVLKGVTIPDGTCI